MSATPSPSATPVTTEHVGKLARRIHGWSWQAFPIGMGTGAVYVSLVDIHHQSSVLTHIETVFFFLNIVLFLLNTSTLALQAILYPRQSWRLIKDPAKGVFVPLIVLSFATIIIGIVNTAVPLGHVSTDTIYALFWTYVAFAVIVCFPMLMIWFNKPHDITTFTPAWAFLIFPMMLVGVVAFNVLDVIPATETRAIGVLLTGYFFQGLGTFMTLFYICIYFVRLMTTGFMDGQQANAAFVAVGPPGFTALALRNLGDHAREILPAHHLVSDNAGEIFYAASVLASLMLFGLAVFLFLFGALPWWSKIHIHLREILGCWSLTFPNVGWIATIRVLGDTFAISGFYTLHLVLVVAMCAVWLVLFVLTLAAFWKGKIFLDNDEDVLRDHRHFAVHAHILHEKGKSEAHRENDVHGHVMPALLHAPTPVRNDLEQGLRPTNCECRTASCSIGGVYYSSTAPTLVDVTDQTQMLRLATPRLP
ncbi:hypothetical protein PUNSTDRAFT_147009 [Punctularia strigosozonata HHB-11173 SS5]|uniref:C4-dicarboxylate transporter/malic acid transport protein n=1 Tax=Punctularia strigosozonata (strain HHB-11173) TaxID=741275 RepID=R7S2V0_PUNST|nr:uncharacterized protein PUNSTDRAFT_147009 [Punctularia strigosozonata HHB-11173 SS5]EIN03576.1 hypothetical protein PUNSTDRAFT_147009 [Punctularia strigosozonata HHB-11173 SS5]